MLGKNMKIKEGNIMMENKTCLNCEKIFTPKYKSVKYCSYICAYKRNQKEIFCKFCGNKIITTNKNKKFCNRKCFFLNLSKSKKYIKECIICKKEFIVSKSKNRMTLPKV